MKCKNCKDTFDPKRFLQKYCTKNECEGIEISLAIQKAKKNLQAQQKKALAKQKQKDNKLKEQLRTYSQRLGIAKRIFQAWIRHRDKDLPCISCGITYGKWNAGHFKKAELYSSIIFNEDNVHKQCVKCNMYLGGNELNYREGLIAKIGLQRVEALEKLALRKPHKYSDEFFEMIKNKYKIL